MPTEREERALVERVVNARHYGDDVLEDLIGLRQWTPTVAESAIDLSTGPGLGIGATWWVQLRMDGQDWAASCYLTAEELLEAGSRWKGFVRGELERLVGQIDTAWNRRAGGSDA